MKRIVWSLMFLFIVIACSPTKQDTQEIEDEKESEYMMDEDIMNEDEEVEDDSLKNRDMLSEIYSKV